MLAKFIKRYKRWYNRYQFNRLCVVDQKLFKLLEIDPNSLIKRGKL